jgi:hypothetical protein
MQFFLSDGITEQYVNRAYYDNSAEHTKMFEVNNVKFAANSQRSL